MIDQRPSAAGQHRRTLLIVLAVSITILIVDVVVGLMANSLALIADAGHVFADVAGTSLSLVAIWLGSRPATRERTFGLYRFEILAALGNAMILFAIAGYVLIEAWSRLFQTPNITSGPMIAVSLATLVANGVSASLLRRGQSSSLTVRSAYLEVLNDAFGSAAVLIAGLVIWSTGFLQADAIASGLIGLLILPRTWTLLRDAIDILLEATPRDVQMAHVRRHILETPGVAEVHDLHVWTITSGMNVVSAHVVVLDHAVPSDVLKQLSRCLSDDFDIEHSTFQLESHEHRRLEETTHA